MATQAQPQAKTAGKTYSLTGALLEACSCRTLCRCWIGEDPDGGACEAFNAYHIDQGEINGVDVSGLNFFSTIAGAPAYVSKAHEHVVNIPEHGMVWKFTDRNAI